MGASTDAAVILAVKQSLRPLILEYFSRDSCVATARIVIDTLDYFGIVARPLAVEAIIFNGEARAIIQSGSSLAELYQVMASIPLSRRGGPWTLGLGLNDDPKVAAGHVVVHVPSVSELLDLSIDQASRPQKGLVLSPMAIPLAGSAFADDPSATVALEVPQPDGFSPAYIEYRHALRPLFQRSPNWRRTSNSGNEGRKVFTEVTGRAIRMAREQVGK